MFRKSLKLLNLKYAQQTSFVKIELQAVRTAPKLTRSSEPEPEKSKDAQEPEPVMWTNRGYLY